VCSGSAFDTADSLLLLVHLLLLFLLLLLLLLLDLLPLLGGAVCILERLWQSIALGELSRRLSPVVFASQKLHELCVRLFVHGRLFLNQLSHIGRHVEKGKTCVNKSEKKQA
jgi:hypothetical protein